MSVLDRAKQHFSAQLAAGPRVIEVEEWADEEGQPCRIYVRPVNLQDRNRIYQAMQTGGLEAFAEALILRARDADGRPMFRRADKLELVKMVDPDVITRIVNDMNSDLDLTAEDAEKN